MIRARGNLLASWALAVVSMGLLASAVVPWQWLAGVARGRSALDLLLLSSALICLIAAFVVRPMYFYTPEFPPGVRNLHTFTAWWAVAAAAVVAATMWATTAWLLHEASSIRPASDQARARIEAIRTGLTAAGGAGAAAALLLAFRRQHHQEHAAKGVEYDAAEKRITELYVKAAEQLGSDKAPVRMAGLYALERLAQGEPGHRRTIANLICAYLRMPFPAGDDDGDAGSPSPDELEVRRTAQGVLLGHLRPADQGFWRDLELNFAGAVLVDFDMRGCRVGPAQFAGATFRGWASFEGTTFDGPASFLGATFPEFANFAGATFQDTAWFSDARFEGRPGRGEVAVHDPRLSDAPAFEGASFCDAVFEDFAAFRSVSFAGDARFDGAAFLDGCAFSSASFLGDARFGRTVFQGGAEFGGEDFTVNAYAGAAFHGLISFDGASFGRPPGFDGVHLSGPLDRAHLPPQGWQVEPDGPDSARLVRG
ncbi:pentapeptide repeat-containing protein [Jidongwangia harbinensis]|uniref:pentapeptide repeat-containing protein n=1 Tax=Jidongwangia harbinensis TaxID=2878561 RepID=UPI001CD9F151|nr:pentapeptide repeat-containing protein [Jidongwangia harbinensis]MCA2218503.1 pentapeptide repeat-containing protein [Jidongwangia harbinensis]